MAKEKTTADETEKGVKVRIIQSPDVMAVQNKLQTILKDCDTIHTIHSSFINQQYTVIAVFE